MYTVLSYRIDEKFGEGKLTNTIEVHKEVQLSESQWILLPKESDRYVTHKEQIDAFMKTCGCIPFFFEVYDEVER